MERFDRGVRVRTAERIANLIVVFCVLSWIIFWMTMMNRVAPVSEAAAGALA